MLNNLVPSINADENTPILKKEKPSSLGNFTPSYNRFLDAISLAVGLYQVAAIPFICSKEIFAHTTPELDLSSASKIIGHFAEAPVMDIINAAVASGSSLFFNIIVAQQTNKFFLQELTDVVQALGCYGKKDALPSHLLKTAVRLMCSLSAVVAALNAAIPYYELTNESLKNENFYIRNLFSFGLGSTFLLTRYFGLMNTVPMIIAEIKTMAQESRFAPSFIQPNRSQRFLKNMAKDIEIRIKLLSQLPSLYVYQQGQSIEENMAEFYLEDTLSPIFPSQHSAYFFNIIPLKLLALLLGAPQFIIAWPFYNKSMEYWQGTSLPLRLQQGLSVGSGLVDCIFFVKAWSKFPSNLEQYFLLTGTMLRAPDPDSELTPGYKALGYGLFALEGTGLLGLFALMGYLAYCASFLVARLGESTHNAAMKIYTMIAAAIVNFTFALQLMKDGLSYCTMQRRTKQQEGYSDLKQLQEAIKLHSAELDESHLDTLEDYRKKRVIPSKTWASYFKLPVYFKDNDNTLTDELTNDDEMFCVPYGASQQSISLSKEG